MFLIVLWMLYVCRFRMKMDGAMIAYHTWHSRSAPFFSPQWRHGVSNHRQLCCLFSSLFMIITTTHQSSALSTGDRWIPRTKCYYCGNDVIMKHVIVGTNVKIEHWRNLPNRNVRELNSNIFARLLATRVDGYLWCVFNCEKFIFWKIIHIIFRAINFETEV